MNVLVTGGAGYIGTELVNLLVSNPSVEKVIVYDNLSRMNYNLFLGLKLKKHTKLSFIKGELLDSRSLRKVLQGVDVVYHLAAKVTTPFASADSHAYEQVNHWGTAELVYAVEESKVKKFIYTSSSGVYGSSKNAVDENTIPNPKTFYAISKLRAEEHVLRLLDTIDTYVFRCGNVYGYSKSMRFDSVINKFVFEANFNKIVTIQGDGKQARSFIHIDLVSNALNNLLSSDLKSGTYNLVERSIKVFDIVDELKQLVPDLEFLFINQHLKLRELKVKKNSLVNQTLGINNPGTLKKELEEFLGRFSF
ncbi:MAG: NAD-dependent epimerase/dehydratase family protein [Cyclobacteriaceae bacterium]|nr:NAD-dependent epimerase/dehydratase family protein [Cyclobacteriaceae bacterium]MDH4295598.1 NAD-dependent epimerase/dehydratase family protein [Cyclobacteriaceae bacterium]MDH5247732.1 NAD-dependent epimerase/dehydratase family protein [Cyclobacteriaceae bacterium]